MATIVLDNQEYTKSVISTGKNQDNNPESKNMRKSKSETILEDSFLSTEQNIILNAIRDLLKPSTLLSQVGGYIPYLLSAKNELITYPPLIAVTLFQLCVHIVAVIFFLQFQQEFISVFGKLSETETVTSSAFCISGLFGQFVLRIALYRNHTNILNYHSKLNSLFCDLCGCTETSLSNNSCPNLYLEWIKKASKRVRNVCLIISLMMIVNFSFFLLFFCALTPFSRISATNKIAFALITIDFAVGSFLFYGFAIWLGSYIQIKQIAFQIIQHQSNSKEFKSLKYVNGNLLENVKQLETLVEDFNDFSVAFLITWFTLNVTMLVSQLYQNLMWIRFQIYYIILASSPSLIAGGMSIYFICTVSAEMTSQGKKSVDSLCSQEVEKTCNETVEQLVNLKKVLFLHSRWQSRPSQISPGGYFVINRCLLTKIIGIMTTYLVVLLGFTDKDTPEWVERWNKMMGFGEFVLFYSGNSSSV